MRKLSGRAQSRPVAGSSAATDAAATLASRAVLDAMGEAVVSADAEGRVRYLNPAAQAMTGWTLADAIGQPLAEVVRVTDGPEPSHQVLVRRTGEVAAVERTIAPVHDGRGTAIGSVTVCRDAGARLALSRALSQRALHDALTGLPNRLLLHDRLTEALACGLRNGHQVAVCFVDVDDLKAVNDAFGHRMGDALLRTVAERLRAAVRGSDTVSRFGGDEFVVVLPHVAHRSNATQLSRKISHGVCRPLRSNGLTIEVSASIGLALAPDDGRNPDALIARADATMYDAKRARASLRGSQPLARRQGVRAVGAHARPAAAASALRMTS